MARWEHRIRIKHLLTDKDDRQSLDKSMNAIADVLERSGLFRDFEFLPTFRSIPPGEGDAVIGPRDYANRLLEWMYDFCDSKRIWVE
jgi:hypothetical protein